jgi:hypothetical protein
MSAANLKTTSTLLVGVAAGFILSCWVTRDNRLLELSILTALISMLFNIYAKRTPRGEPR